MEANHKSALYDEHLKLTEKSHLAPFAGYLMPLWYTSISAEHQAVRQAAGIFDCTHMGVWQVTGATAGEYLDLITTNKAAKLKTGRAQYSYILDQDGSVLDDIIVYRRSEDNYLVVVNAANNDKIARWFYTVQQYLQGKISVFPTIRDLRDTGYGDICRVDIALQGPAAQAILSDLLAVEQRAVLFQMTPFQLLETRIKDIEVMISTTGYTGAKIGYELLVHPDRAGRLWQLLLEHGHDHGLLPCGLGARDSLRIEAGLPLYGHELDGEYDISPFEAGYGWAVKLDKEYFVGRDAMLHKSKTYSMAVQRLELPGKSGVRPIRPGDAVLDEGSKCIGWVLSCAKVSDRQIALAYLGREAVHTGDPIGVYYLARNPRHIQQGRKETANQGDTLPADIRGTVLERMAKF